MTEQVQAYLEQHASEDEVFAYKMRNPKKSIKNCIKFIAQKAMAYMEKHKEEYEMENGYGGDVPDEICYGWANHYYDENDLEVDMTEEELKAKREKERKEREEKWAKEKAERDAKAKTEKKEKAAAARKAKAEEKKAEKAKVQAEKAKTEKPKNLTKAQMRKGEDCYSLFDF